VSREGEARIVVAMSGGVDSSVAAAMLVEAGADAIGVTMKLSESESRCCSLEDADDARRVAERIGIRFYVANYADAFTKEVVEPFADAYLAARTPIPCVACNQSFKFDHLLERARGDGDGRVSRSGLSFSPRRLRHRQRDVGDVVQRTRRKRVAEPVGGARGARFFGRPARETLGTLEERSRVFQER